MGGRGKQTSKFEASLSYIVKPASTNKPFTPSLVAPQNEILLLLKFFYVCYCVMGGVRVGPHSHKKHAEVRGQLSVSSLPSTQGLRIEFLLADQHSKRFDPLGHQAWSRSS